VIIAAHVIITTYGFWLPNDPRGSWSDFVASWEILKFGTATKVTTRRSVAHVRHDQSLRRAAKQALRFPPVRFTGGQALAVGQGFARAIAEGKYVVNACSILPDHVHLVIARHARLFERITSHLKSNATRRLREDGLDPLARFAGADGTLPTPWAGGLWKVFIDDGKHWSAAIKYVEDNPLKEGKPRQTWSFVTPRE
jgi:REP element-mobilizing transposase RayT